MPRKLTWFLFIILSLGLNPFLVLAAPNQQTPAGEEYTVQAGDWLTKIAEKYFGQALAYQGIIDATNAKAAEDSSFATITNPDVIVVGQKLWIPTAQAGAGELTAEGITFSPVTVDKLGIQSVVPKNWPASK